MDADYTPERIEAEARQYWEEHRAFRVSEDPAREKFYRLKQ